MNYELKSISQVSTAWEDNVGAESLPNEKVPLTPSRIKSLSFKYHWFRSKIKLSKIETCWVGTKEQRAEFFTKGLT